MAIASGVVFFHRFYAQHSFRDYDRFVSSPADSTLPLILIDFLVAFYLLFQAMAISCLFLASKAEETPKKLIEVVQAALRTAKKDPLPIDHPVHNSSFIYNLSN